MLKDCVRALKVIFNGVGTMSAEGWGLAKYGFAVFAAGFFLAFFTDKLGLAIALLGVIFTAFCFFFFRDPKREFEYPPDEIISPADGKILSVKIEDDPNTIVVRIFLSIFDVHIQRAPIEGTVGEITYTKGTFLSANNPLAEKNERNLIRISDGEKYAHIEQITGAVARRIVSWVKKDDAVKAGGKVGLIYFGSQVALYLPADKARVLVRPAQKVEGGITTIALWK